MDIKDDDSRTDHLSLLVFVLIMNQFQMSCYVLI